MKIRLTDLLMFLLILAGWTSQKAVAQSINLTLKYNTSSSVYEVYGRPTFTSAKFGIGAGSQISIVVPASVPDNALTVTPVNGGPWNDGSKIYAPTADPAHDFHGIATTGDYASLTAGQELLLFTFSLSGGCMPGIRLFDNSTDPGSNAAGMGGGDFANYLGDAVSFGADVYGSNYVSPGGLCGTPPTLTITGPSGTQTSTSPTVSGTATPGSVVTITGPNNTTLCSTTATAGGSFSCVVSVSTGPVTVTVAATNASGTTTSTTSFTAVPAPSLVVNPPAPGPITQPVSGTTTPGDLVTITGPGNQTLCSTTASASGAFSCAVTLPPGSSTLIVATTGPGGTTTTPVTVTAVSVPTVTINGPATGSQTSTSPTVSGTATPGTLVTIAGPGNATLCSTTATAGGSYSCTVNVSTGPATLTVTAANPGGTVSTTTSFTAVPTPVIAINPPAPGPLTQPISGTTTPGNQVTITGPGKQTLCSTVASASGIFSCSVTVPTGPSTLTVTTAGPGGTTTTPVAVTGVSTPIIMAGSPSGTQTSTTPTVSGTATPGSVVTITGPGNATLCSTTATAGGSYSCTVNVATGPNTLTVTATNPGGTATSTVSFTAAGAVQLSMRVLLQGALTRSTTAGIMRDDLRSKNLIPTTEPHTALGFAQTGGGGGELISNPSAVLSVTGTNAVIDWIFVELRSAANPALVLATRSALLQADGDIVGMDGVSALTITSSALNNVASCYVAIRHRNHLGVMTTSPVSTSALATIDFTNAATVYQFPIGNAMRTTAPLAVEGGFHALWAGNTSGDNQTILQGPGNDVDPIFFNVLVDPNNTGGFTNFVRSNVYSVNDIDMDGRVIFQGPNNEIDYIFFETMTHPDNPNAYVNFIIKQQLP